MYTNNIFRKPLLMGVSLLIAAGLYLHADAANAQLAYDLASGVGNDNPFEKVGKKGHEFVSGFFNYIVPLIILASLIWGLILFKMNKLDWAGIFRIIGTAVCLVLVGEFAKWLFQAAAG